MPAWPRTHKSTILIGFLSIDKPQGVTSHYVVARVRRIAGMRRVGHAGTLDPLATGVLVVGLGRATRLMEYVVGQPKIYLTTMRLGQVTDTFDADGAVLETNQVAVSEQQLIAALAPFRGEIEQVPPMFSAIKRDGQPLYKLARQGKTVERKARQVTIDRLEVVGRDGNDVTLRIGCSTGTYIRSLVHDLGVALGCGAHVVMLRRTAVGSFSAESPFDQPASADPRFAAVPLDDLNPNNIARHLLPSDLAIAQLQRIDLSGQDAQALRFGRRISAEKSQKAQIIRAYVDDSFLGILRREGDRWHPHKLFLD